MNKKIGLFFGTFNPIHIGHVIIANHMAEFSDLDEVWLVVTPHNPHKKKSTLLDNHNRLDMVFMACEEFEHLQPSDVEFRLEQPNYTVKTLAHLQEKYPTNEFCLIMGEDNLKTFHKWKNYEVILDNHSLYVYPRKSGGKVENQFKDHPKITRVDAPVIEISATFIRDSIKEGKFIKPMLPAKVWEYVIHNNFYK
ncbi:nicotinate (nicotinamide) nucleotide adenylyltransferase [Zunongwangia profunda]|jgi:nicotinate-nucleotide adenylyltransferase|uniref:Probable nicotinate-nucleotide adenylyltransferase n=2 Tax=Zunongwangia profunda TaxID=398743 RepID=D5BDV2_ZUNPS|nr:nicotinate (nicotinamide) nucleotide adenylyltransferase [Zunongwangia profunda]ADF50693.1 nicotinic acid mononucleotide adenylyltransferase [Zunongwangia profunda SM-A87]MAC64376.1 nicotinate-nucleotide adenylyltransferase [Flavobacteriaceae bacterium]MAS71511.1 nicotinate-nucleotide adenylyltransferase [Zunongwangia sp.]HCV79765.1 nicotinate-nucleotide adenylyltransferase [Zunongwangia profunda]|tara:strand:+ start:13 stop:597 length:585 start_codon:yes stop_codon:yes gene_type:complete